MEKNTDKKYIAFLCIKKSCSKIIKNEILFHKYLVTGDS